MWAEERPCYAAADSDGHVQGWSMPPIPTPEVQEESHDALGAPKGLG